MSTWRTKGLFAISIALIGASLGTANADLSTNQVEQSRAAATNSLKQFRALIKASNYKLLGLDSINQAAQLTVGEPLRIYRISMARLAGYNTNQNFNALINYAPEVIYSFNVSTGAVASSILRLEASGWQTASLGQPRLIRSLERLRKHAEDEAHKAGTPAPALMAVTLPFGSTWMTGYYDSSTNLVLYANVTNSAPWSPLHIAHPVSPTEMNRWADAARAYSGLSN